MKAESPKKISRLPGNAMKSSQSFPCRDYIALFHKKGNKQGFVAIGHLNG